MRIIPLLLFLLGFGLASGQRLSDQAQISIITCGPYQGELYSAFGHSAIRVYDPVQEYDVAFNYGVFDFDQPNFYLNFTKGYLYYKLGVYDYPSFRDYYISHNRFVHEQILNLTPYQKEKLFNYLSWNAEPENQNYVYDYFKNNCATKIKEVVVKALGDSVKFTFDHIKSDYSIRQLTDIYLVEQPWGDFGIDLCLGSPIDVKATPEEYLFLPDYIESAFKYATIAGKPLAGNVMEIYTPVSITTGFNWNQPIYIFSGIAILLLVFSFRDFKRQKLSVWIDYVLLGVTGLIGIILLLLWIATDHEPAAWNLNLVWAMPLNGVVLFLLKKKQLRFYFLINAFLTFLLLAFWMVLPQQLNVGVIPILILLSARWFLKYKLA